MRVHPGTVMLVSVIASINCSNATKTSQGYTSGPYFVSEVENATVSKGRHIELHCNVDNIGQYQVGWLRAESQTVLTLATRVITTDRRVHVHHLAPNGWTLQVRRATRADSGCYMCQLNTQPMISRTGCVTVNEPPRYVGARTSDDETIQLGANVTLRCTTTGDPTPQVTWLREDGDRVVGVIKHTRNVGTIGEVTSSLTMTTVEKHQRGAYLCIANNGVPPAISKRVNINVLYAPQVRIPVRAVAAGRNIAVLRCQVDSNPPAQILWHRMSDNTTLFPGKRVEITESYVGKNRVHASLKIQPLLENDNGRYVCSAVNVLGRAHGTLLVTQNQQPMSPPKPRQPVMPAPYFNDQRPTLRTQTAPATLSPWYVVSDASPSQDVDTKRHTTSDAKQRSTLGLTKTVIVTLAVLQLWVSVKTDRL